MRAVSFLGREVFFADILEEKENMAHTLQPSPYWDDLEAEHRIWLSAFDSQYLRNWEKMRNGNREAGLCEAGVRRLLQEHSITVEPNEELTGSEQRPDYRCTHPEESFLVEVTCIMIDSVAEESGLPYPSKPHCGGYRHLNDAIFKTCKGKAPQCGNASQPTLIAVGTFHSAASVLCFQRKFADMLLCGETNISWMVDTQTGRGVGDSYQTTKLYSAPFLRPDQQLSEARTSISGVLLCGFGIAPPRVLGVLHPGAIRPFNHRLLSGIDFGEVQVDRVSGKLSTSWTGGTDE
jgi:hypothetical protein